MELVNESSYQVNVTGDDGGDSVDDIECLPDDLMAIMIKLLGKKSKTMQYLVNNCSTNSNSTASPLWNKDISSSHKKDLHMLYASQSFYAYITPIIIAIGIIGNVISMKIFTTRRMRKVSASFYLTALAISDTLVLVTYVLPDWLPRGLHKWPGNYSYDILAFPGLCQTFLFLSYVFRFMSAWLIVIFTVERFIGVCKPLHRRAWCTDTFAKKAIFGIIMFAVIFSSYKPALSGIVHHGNSTICTRKTDYHVLNFALDGLYACLITALPFAIIMILNCMIIKTLNDTKRRHRSSKLTVDESSIKLEFTAILLIISTTFVVLNLPYFILWCVNFNQQLTNWIAITNPTQMERLRGWMYIAKTIFFGNYCVNFCLYSMTGAYFRRQLMALMCKDSACMAADYNSQGVSQNSNIQGIPMTTRLALTSVLQTELLHQKDSIRKKSWVVTNNYSCRSKRNQM